MAFKTSIILSLSILLISFGLSSTSVAQIERSVSIAEKNLKVKLNQSSVEFGNLTNANVFSKIGRFESTSVLYSVQWERRDWYFITDGKAKGWVSKKDVSLASKASSTASAKPIASPVKVILDLKKIGFGVDLSWRKSKLVPGEWFCQMRCYHGASGRLMTAAQLLKLDPASVYDGTKYNELNISLFGEDRSSLERIEVSAEIYQSKFQKKSFSTLLRAVEQVVGECPAQVKSAFESGKAYKRKPWLVERDYHNAGFDQDLTYFIIEWDK
ncbi:hypothetical protein N9B43_00830 [Mariniblastus sp.]|nr:hypothetical protein [Mariniblastus sp.]